MSSVKLHIKRLLIGALAFTLVIGIGIGFAHALMWLTEWAYTKYLMSVIGGSIMSYGLGYLIILGMKDR